MQFAIRTLAPDMSIASLVVDAVDEADARRQIEARGLVVSAIAPQRAALVRRRASRFALLLFSQELLALLIAGLGIVEALEALLDKEASNAARGSFERLLVSLREGKRFSSALAAQPDLFPPLYVGIVRAAEGTSDLPRALERYIEYQQRVDVVRAKVVSASIYPLILLTVGGAVSAFLIAYVVPRFAEVYQGAGRNLPWLSQVMLDWGQFAARHGAVLATAAVFTAVTAFAGLRHVLQSGLIIRMLGRLPGIGERVYILELSRLYLTLGMLSEGGITLISAIDTVELMVSPPLRQALRAARTEIADGRPLSEAFETHGLTTPVSLRMLRVGERTGEMGTMFSRSAAFYDGEISRSIEHFTRTFEPLLMAAIGLVVGAIVILLYTPIFDLAGDMQ